jgi:hypothetical protein
MHPQVTLLATATPTGGSGPVAAAAGSMTITVTGCPGPVAALSLAGVQVQLLRSTSWSVSGSAVASDGDSDSNSTPAAPASAVGGALRMSSGSTRDVAVSLHYSAQPRPDQQQLAGSVVVRNRGGSDLLLQQLLVEVLPQSTAAEPAAAAAAAAGRGRGQRLGPVLLLPARCSTSSAAAAWGLMTTGAAAGSDGAHRPLLLPAAVVPAGDSVHCSFAGPLPAGVSGTASLTALLMQQDGTLSVSAPALVNVGLPGDVTHAGSCAMVSDGFLGARGRVVPSHSSRPAGAAAPQLICGSRSVSFVATLGPLGQEACGRRLSVSGRGQAALSSLTACLPPLALLTARCSLACASSWQLVHLARVAPIAPADAAPGSAGGSSSTLTSLPVEVVCAGAALSGGGGGSSERAGRVHAAAGSARRRRAPAAEGRDGEQQ